MYTESEEKYDLSSHGRTLLNRQKIEDYDKLLSNKFVSKTSAQLNRSKNFLFGKDYDYKAKNNLRGIIVIPFF